MPVSPFGDRVLVRFYVINDANQSIQPLLVATGTKVRLDIPTGNSDALRLRGYISANNVEVSPVTDTVELRSDLPFRIEYVRGSAKAYSHDLPRGVIVSDDIVLPKGAFIGSRQLDGELLADFQNDVVVTLELRILKA